MASLCGKQEVILQTLSKIRKTTPICLPSFRSYLDIMAMNVDQAEYKRFLKYIDQSDVGALSGLQRATAQLHRYQYPPVTNAQAQQILQQQQNEKNSPQQQKGHTYFFEKVVPFLLDRALEFPELFPEGKLPLAQYNPKNVRGREETKIELTRRQILTIHALCFLGCDPSFEQRRNDVGSLSWFSIFLSGSSRVGVERILCQLMYFEYWRDRFEKLNDNNAGGPQLDEKVSYTRVAFPEIEALAKAGTQQQDSSSSNDDHNQNIYNNKNQSLPDWNNPSSTLDQTPLLLCPPSSNSKYGSVISKFGIHIEGKFMEDFSEANVHVDFANEQLMIGRIIPSMTQEEVMFSVRPELLVSLLLFDTMRPREAIIMKNGITYLNYRGYRDTFVVNSFVPSLVAGAPTCLKTAPEVIAIDAHVNFSGGRRQFKTEMNQRDLDKIFVGFSSTTTASTVGGDNADNDDDDAENKSSQKQNQKGVQVEADIIATGPLGCGAFNGDSGLKFLQQLMAAACCQPRRYLCYYERAPDPYRVLAKLILYKNVSVGAAYRWIDEYSNMEGASRTQTSSDAAPPIQLSNPSSLNLQNHQHQQQQEENLSTVVQDLEGLGKSMMANGVVQKSTFAYFLMQKLIAF